MIRIVLSLPDSLGEWAEKQAANKNFNSVGDYVESLLLEERERHEAIEEFDRLVQEGEDSGISERTMDEIATRSQATLEDDLTIAVTCAPCPIRPRGGCCTAISQNFGTGLPALR